MNDIKVYWMAFEDEYGHDIHLYVEAWGKHEVIMDVRPNTFWNQNGQRNLTEWRDKLIGKDMSEAMALPGFMAKVKAWDYTYEEVLHYENGLTCNTIEKVCDPPLSEVFQD